MNFTDINNTPLSVTPLLENAINNDVSWPDSLPSASVIGAPDIGAIELAALLDVFGSFPSTAHFYGGVPIVIYGEGFDGNTVVTVGGVVLASPMLISSSVIYGAVPFSAYSNRSVVPVDIIVQKKWTASSCKL